MSVRGKQSWFRRVAFAGAVLATAAFSLGEASLPAAAQYYPEAMGAMADIQATDTAVSVSILSLLRLTAIPIIGVGHGSAWAGAGAAGGAAVSTDAVSTGAVSAGAVSLAAAFTAAALLVEASMVVVAAGIANS